ALHRLPGAAVTAVSEQKRLEPLQLLSAEVVLAALHDRDLDVASERRGGHRHVVSKQLLLERLGRRRDDDPPAGFERRQQVGEALADTGSGLGDEVATRRERR